MEAIGSLDFVECDVSGLGVGRGKVGGVSPAAGQLQRDGFVEQVQAGELFFKAFLGLGHGSGSFGFGGEFGLCWCLRLG